MSLIGYLVAQIHVDIASSPHAHQVEIRTMDEDGRQVSPPQRGQLKSEDGRPGKLNLIIGFAHQLPKAGTYSFILFVDNHEEDRLTVEAELVDNQPPQQKEKSQ